MQLTKSHFRFMVFFMKSPHIRCLAGVLLIHFVILGCGAPVCGASGVMVAWGDNAYGQTNPPSSQENIVAIAAGYEHSLALKPDGSVVGWGSYRTATNYVPISIPAALSNVTAIAGGLAHSLALKADGTVIAWGFDYHGQTNVPSELTNAVAIAAGLNHSLALKGDGTVTAWGYNYYGQTDVPPGLRNVVAIAGGANHSLALKADGTVVAWGQAAYGQTAIPPNLNNVVAIAGGGWHSLALKADGTVVAWGRNESGQTGVPPGLTNVVAIAAGWSHNLALKKDGTVTAWGDSFSGQTNVPSGLENVVSIAAGVNHSLALAGNGPPFLSNRLVDRTVVGGKNVQFHIEATGAWPLSYQWRLNGTNLPSASHAWLALTNVQPNQAGSYSVVVSNAFGEGTNSNALLTVVPLLIAVAPQSRQAWIGGSATFSVSVESSLPVRYQWRFNGEEIPGAINATFTLTGLQPAQSGAYSVTISNGFGSVTSEAAILAVGLVRAWGGNSYGQTNVPTNLIGVVAVAAGGDHNLALKADGRVVAWGSYYTGQGNGYAAATVPLDLPKATAIAAGFSHSLALASDGTVAAWGSGFQASVPPSLTNVVAVGAGAYHSLALARLSQPEGKNTIFGKYFCENPFVSTIFLAEKPWLQT